ncbi:hypothetical protein HHK36_027804 [Tetracentron sinense]|uniref:Uncharacterized protein n=1 Tax=Tetracentron sinense TaxID=13715 RepID=A0A835D3W1_TETSI|nr:hypothetical protein HHK36_027804 [Tetracentron sinense]
MGKEDAGYNHILTSILESETMCSLLQVNQLVQVAQKYQSTVTESGSDGVSPQDLLTNCNMFMTAGRQLAKNFESQSLNDLGFSKRYVRNLQISEVISSMKELMDFSHEHTVGPIGNSFTAVIKVLSTETLVEHGALMPYENYDIKFLESCRRCSVSRIFCNLIATRFAESLKIYPRQTTTTKLQMQELEQLVNAHGLPTDRNTLNKLMASNSGLTNHMSNNQYTVSGGVLNASAQAAVALTNSNNMLRQNSMNSNANACQQEASYSFNSSNQIPSSPFQDPRSLIPGSMQDLPVNGLSSQQLHSLNANNSHQLSHPQSSQGSQNLQQQMLQQLLQEMMSNRGEGEVQQQSLGGQNANGSLGEDVFIGANGISGGGLQVRAGGTGVLGNVSVFGNSSCAGPGAAANVSGSVMGATPNRSNNLKPPSNKNSLMIGGRNSFNQRAPDVPQNLRLPGMVQNIAHEFTENGVFNTDPGDMGYGWKA